MKERKILQLAENCEPEFIAEDVIRIEAICDNCEGVGGYETDHWNYYQDTHYNKSHACETCKGDKSVTLELGLEDSDIPKIVGMPIEIINAHKKLIEEMD